MMNSEEEIVVEKCMGCRGNDGMGRERGKKRRNNRKLF